MLWTVHPLYTIITHILAANYAFVFPPQAERSVKFPPAIRANLFQNITLSISINKEKGKIYPFI